MAPLAALWAVLAPWLLGVLVLRALGIRPKDDPLAFAGWSLCAGSLALGVLLLAALLLGVPPGWFWVLPLVGAAASLPFWRRSVASPSPVPAHGPWWLCGVGALLALTVLRMLAASAWPCFEGDEGNIWSLKAKTLFAGLGPEFASLQVFNLHPDYPLLNPLLQTWVYACNGGIVLFENRWPVLCFVPAMVLIAAAALRRCLRPWPAFLVLVLLVGCRELRISSGRAFGDAMVACGMLMLLDGWLRWQDSPQPRFRRLAALGLAVAAWSKNETAMYLCAIAAAAAITALLERRRLRPLSLLPWIGPALAVLAVQWTFNWSFGLHNDLLGHNPTGKGMAVLMVEQFPQRVLPVLARAGAEMIDPGSPQGAMLLLVPLGLWWAWRRGALPLRLSVPGFALLLALAGMHAVYVGSFLDLQRHLDTSYARVLFQALPATLLWLAALASAMLARPAAALVPP